MANLYFKVRDGKVVGCQTTKGEIDAEEYIKVDEATYNQFGKLAPYETMTYDGNEFTINPDPRPVLRITVNQQGKIGERVDIVVDQMDSKLKVDAEQLIEYESPDGRIGIVKAKFNGGEAFISFTPDKSGYYSLRGSANYKPEEAKTIAVYEE